MKRFKLFFVVLLIISSSFLLIYNRSPTRLEVDPTEPTEFTIFADTSILLIDTEGDLTFSIEIFDRKNNYTNQIYSSDDHTGDLEVQLPRAGVYYIVLTSNTIGSFEVETTGIPTSYVIYMVLVGLMTLVAWSNDLKRLVVGNL